MTPTLSILTDIQFCHWERDWGREGIRGDHLGLAHTHIHTCSYLRLHRGAPFIYSVTHWLVLVTEMPVPFTYTHTVIYTVTYVHQSGTFVCFMYVSH